MSKPNADAHDADMNEHDVLVSIRTDALKPNTNSVPQITKASVLPIEGATETRLYAVRGGLSACWNWPPGLELYVEGANGGL